MKYFKEYIPAIMSGVSILLYFSPWLFSFDSNMTMLGLFALGFMWLGIFAWIFVAMKIVDIVKSIRSKTYNKHKLISLLVMPPCFVIIIIAMQNHYFLTV